MERSFYQLNNDEGSFTLYEKCVYVCLVLKRKWPRGMYIFQKIYAMEREREGEKYAFLSAALRKENISEIHFSSDGA